MKKNDKSELRFKTPKLNRIYVGLMEFDNENSNFISMKQMKQLEKSEYISVQITDYAYSFDIGRDCSSIKKQLKTQGIKIDDANLKHTEKYLKKSFKHLQKGIVCEDVFKLMLKYFHDIVVIELRKSISKTNNIK
jgi:hypothetical protein